MGTGACSHKDIAPSNSGHSPGTVLQKQPRSPTLRTVLLPSPNPAFVSTLIPTNIHLTARQFL